MTRYVNIRSSVENSEVGDYPQADLVKACEWDQPHSVFMIKELDKDENYSIEKTAFKIPQSHKLTDVVFFNNDFFIVSGRVMDILKDFSLPPWKQFDCTIKHKDKTYPYHILYFINGRYDFTDYRKSRFTLRYFEKDSHVNTVFYTKKALLQAEKEAHQFFTNFIYVQTGKKIPFDWFKVHERQTNFFISEKLQQAFISNNITGVDYLENADTVFSPAEEKNIIEVHRLNSIHFLTRTSWFSNGTLCRRFDPKRKIVEEFRRTGIKERELIFQRGKFEGSERSFFSNGHIQLEKLVKNKKEVEYKYYFQNGQLNYSLTSHDTKGWFCDKVFSIEGKELKKYKLVRGSGKILHFNKNGKGGRELTFKKHELLRERKF